MNDVDADEVLLMAALKASGFPPKAKERQKANDVDKNQKKTCWMAPCRVKEMIYS